MRWLIVAGGAHRRGGQDRANLELVRYLSRQALGEIHLVVHELDPEVHALPRVNIQAIPRALQSTLLGERLLERAAARTHSRLGPGTIVLANGGNYTRAQVNWVHSLHTVWPVQDEGAPIPRRVFNRAKKWDARRREQRALRSARMIIANSARTARDLLAALQVPSEKVVAISFGADPQPRSKRERAEGMQLAFVGALGWDRNKGLDIALRALRLLVNEGDEHTALVVAGPGALRPWQRMATELGLQRRVTFLGMVDDVPALLRRTDLLVSPVRYEAYGLAIQEALVAGVPALVSANAGIAAWSQPVLPQLIVSDNEDPGAWAKAIRRAFRDLKGLRNAVADFGTVLAGRSWEQMAADIVREIRIRILERG